MSKELTEPEKLRLHYNNTVRRDQRFKGEKPYVPYFWDMFVQGSDYEDITTEDGDLIVIFKVTQTDRDLFPELDIGDLYYCREDEVTDTVTGAVHARKQSQGSSKAVPPDSNTAQVPS